MREERKLGFVRIFAVSVALLAAYLGSYFLLVKPRLVWDGGTHVLATPFYAGCLPLPEAEKLIWSRRVSPFFQPVHWLDRRLRAETWKTTVWRR